MPCALEININVGVKREHVNLTLQSLKTSHLNYHNAYGHQTWKSGDLP